MKRNSSCYEGLPILPVMFSVLILKIYIS